MRYFVLVLTMIISASCSVLDKPTHRFPAADLGPSIIVKLDPPVEENVIRLTKQFVNAYPRLKMSKTGFQRNIINTLDGTENDYKIDDKYLDYAKRFAFCTKDSSTFEIVVSRNTVKKYPVSYAVCNYVSACLHNMDITESVDIELSHNMETIAEIRVPAYCEVIKE